MPSSRFIQKCVFCSIALLVCSSVASAQIDVTKKLDVAKAAYERESEEITKLISDYLDDLERKSQKRGDKKRCRCSKCSARF